MPLHLISFFFIPNWVLNRVDSIRRSFFWKSDRYSHGCSFLVNWDTCCKPKHIGGLGILYLRLFNISLLSKWWWKLMTEPSSPWANLVLHFCYHQTHHLLAIHHPPPSSASPFWRGVTKMGEYFKLGAKFVLGNRENIRFWLDPWFGAHPLALDYSTLFEMASDPTSSIVANSLGRTWYPTFRSILSPENIVGLKCSYKVSNILMTKYHGHYILLGVSLSALYTATLHRPPHHPSRSRSSGPSRFLPKLRSTSSWWLKISS